MLLFDRSSNKKGAPDHGRSQNLREEAPTNSTRPAPQLVGRWSKHCFIGSRALQLRFAVFWEAET